MLFTVLLVVSAFVALISYYISSYNEKYWKKRGVVYDGGKNVFETFIKYFKNDKPLYEYFKEIYFKYPQEPVVAMPTLLKPTLLIRDPLNVQHVLATNFGAFHHRGVEVSENDILAKNVLFLNGPVWKITRQKMTPLFTSSKLRDMFYIMDRSAMDYVDYLNKHIKKGHIHQEGKSNAFDTLSLFCCASISAAVFGLGTESTFKSPFLEIAKAATRPNWKSDLKFFFNSMFPSLFLKLQIRLFEDLETRFVGAMKQVLKEREKETLKKHDFPELALKLKREGVMKDSSTGTEIQATDEVMAAQGFFFLIAGVDPSATGMFFTLFELAKHPEIQRTLQKDIDKAIEDTNGIINFDVVSKLNYLDMVIEEGLRMYPPVATMGRKCTSDTVLPVGNVKIEKGSLINISVIAMHHDPNLYPDPENFDPERFTPQAVKDRRNMTFLPFGEGNRACIGSRFAYLQMKTGIIHILKNFDVVTKDQNKKVEFVKTAIFVRPKNVDFQFVPRK